MLEEDVWNYVQDEANSLIEWSKCGESIWSVIPSLLWAVGAAALAHRLLYALFRRYLFRRVPVWEVILQHMLFLWMVIYSLHFWVLLVRIIKVIVDYCNEDDRNLYPDNYEGRKAMQQWVIWMCGVMPLAFYIQTRPRPEHVPLMIWYHRITTNPWQRREMGPYGYYLNRPPPPLASSTNVPARPQSTFTRRAYSDSRIIIKEPAKKKRHSKSI